MSTSRNSQKSKLQHMHSEKIRKNEFSKNDEIVFGISCYTRETASRRLSAFKNQVQWKGNELFSFPFLTTFLDSARFQGTYLFFYNLTYCLNGFSMLSF
jgi:hypothetical protein